MIYILRQKFSIIAFQNGSRNAWLKRITVIQNFDVIVPIRCHGNKGKIRICSGLKSTVIKILHDES